MHCFSFLCLAVSAVSFAWAKPWPGRIALAAPFALSALQALRPDSAEALAIRLWQAGRVFRMLSGARPPGAGEAD